MNILIINQDSQTTRMDFQRRQLSSLGLSFDRVPAYQLSGAEDEVFQKYYETWQRPLSQAEVSCFLSHKTAWEIILSSNKPMLIIEDDAWLHNDISTFLNDLNKVKDVDYVTLEVTGSNRRKLISKRANQLSSQFSILRLYQDRSGSGGYVLWPTGAKKLLNKAKNNKAALADKFLSSCYCLKAYHAEPALIIQLDQCKSHGITPPLEVQSSISSKTKSKSKSNSVVKLRYKLRRILGEVKIGLNLLLHFYGTERRQIALSNNFKKRSQQ